MKSKHNPGVALMIASSCCACLGQLLWKLSISGISGTNGKPLYLFFGFLLYGAGFAAMITAYKYGGVSKLQPILSMQYVFAVLLGYLVLGESIGVHRLVGIVIIAAAAALIGSSAH